MAEAHKENTKCNNYPYQYEKNTFTDETNFETAKYSTNRVTSDSVKATGAKSNFEGSNSNYSLVNKNTNATEQRWKNKSMHVKQNSYSNLAGSTSKMLSENSLSYMENIKQLESMISEIKFNGFDKIKSEQDEKLKYRKHLENNVNSLENSLKIIRSYSKNQGSNNSKLIKENDRLLLTGERINRDLYFMNMEIPELKEDIEKMNVEISLKNEELRYIRNDSIEMDRGILLLKDEIKKVNKSNSDLKKEKESLRNGISLLRKHIDSIKEKIKKQDDNSKQFMTSVSTLLDQSYRSTQSQNR